MNVPKKCPVCGSTRMKRLPVPIKKNGFLIFAKCFGKSTRERKRCNGEGYEWGIDERTINIS